jgi:ABC-type Mn2+/Zn2+ transport system permease subunit
LIIIWIAAISASIFGLLFAYYLDFSIGPAIALLLGIELIIAATIGKLVRV